MTTTVPACTTAACARHLFPSPLIVQPAPVRVFSTRTGTNQNGTLNLILTLDGMTLPPDLRDDLLSWITLDLRPPTYHAQILMGRTVSRDAQGKTHDEPIIYHGAVKFDTAPCAIGRDCPRAFFLIVPLGYYAQNTDLTEIRLMSVRRHRTPPCS